MHVFRCCFAVIKPIYGAASIGVVKVTTAEELQSTYTRVTKEMKGARIVAGAIQQAADDVDDESTDQVNHTTPAARVS